MSKPAAKPRSAAKKSPIVGVTAEDGEHIEPPPPEVVEQEKARLADWKAKLAQLGEMLGALS